jgi:hypothetical protein
MLKRGTHAPPKHVVGLYTSVAWKAPCREVAKLRLTPREALSEDVVHVGVPSVAAEKITGGADSHVRYVRVTDGDSGLAARWQPPSSFLRASDPPYPPP